MTEQHPDPQHEPAGPPEQPPSHAAAPPPYAEQQPAPGQLPAYDPQQGGPYAAAPVGYPQAGRVGQIRSTGTCILLYIVTLGIYGIYWYYKVHDEMKRHSNEGLGGVVALLLALFVGIVMPYITSAEVGDMYERDGKAKPVSAATGLWVFPGIFILVGPIVWFVKTNGALNDHWASKGAGQN
ncbi:MAG: DUF4234 domain-containing protein [Nocardioidaceae bacterium]